MDYICKVQGSGVYETAKLSSGILNANVGKLSTIPSILALGFGSGMVPYLTESLEQHDNVKISKQVNQILDAVAFILIPIILIFMFFGKDIYFIMYGNANLELGTKILLHSNIQTLLGTICPILSSIMVTLKLRQSTINSLYVAIILKLITFFPLVKYFGVYGMIYSGAIYYGIQILIYLLLLKKNFDVEIYTSIRRFLSIIICSLVALIPAVLIYEFIPFNYTSRLLDIVIMGFIGIIILIFYYGTSFAFELPQEIFNIKQIDFKELISRFKK